MLSFSRGEGKSCLERTRRRASRDGSGPDRALRALSPLRGSASVQSYREMGDEHTTRKPM